MEQVEVVLEIWVRMQAAGVKVVPTALDSKVNVPVGAMADPDPVESLTEATQVETSP